MARRLRVALGVAALLAVLGFLGVALLRRDAPGASPRAPSTATAVPAAPPAPADVRPRPVLWPPAVRLAPPARAPPGSATGQGAFEGRVVSIRTGRGLPRAQLTFAHSGATTSVTAGADGRFRFEPHEAGRWTLAAATADGHLPFAPEWGQSPVLLEARAGTVVRGLVVALAPAEPFTGLVVDRGGKPVAGAEVRVLGGGAGTAALVPLADRFRSGADGIFRFTAPEDAVIEARADGYGAGRTRIDFAARVSRKVTIRLGPAAGELLAIEGTVQDRAGAPVEDALVSGVRKDRPSAPPASARSDVEGRFRVDGLAPGTWVLTAARPGSAPASVTADAGASGVRIRLGAGGALAGQVRDRRSGAAVAPFTVLVQGAEARGLSVVDPTGAYAFDDLAPGAASVQVFAPGYAPSAEVRVTIPEPGALPATQDFELAPGGTLTGVVVERGSGRPIAGARVEVEGAPPSLGVPVRSEAQTGEDGTFTLLGLAATRVSIVVYAPDHHGRILSAPPIPEGETRGPITIDLSPLAPGEDPQLELSGIGAGVSKERIGAPVVLTGVIAGGGAAEAGLAPGDEIHAVDGVPVDDLALADAVPLLRGPEGTTVVLLVIRPADPTRTPFEVVVVRRLIRV